MTYEEQLDAARLRRQEEAERRRAEAQIDAEARVAERKDLGEALLRIVAGDITSATLGESCADVDARLWAALGFGGAPRPDKSRDPMVAADGDPISALTKAERAEIEADPKRLQRFRERVASAEHGVAEEREIQRNREEIWAAHDANERADEAADRVIAERAKARGGV